MRNVNKKTGFSLIELLTAVSVLSILMGIGIVSYKSAIDRTKIISTKANMHVVQTTIETYAMYNNGIYPNSVAALKTEGQVEGYWKNLKNPVSLQIDPITDLALTTTIPAGGVGYRAGFEDPFLIGSSLTFVRRYAALATATDTTTGTGSITSYSIVGTDPKGSIIAKGDGSMFVLTNGNYTPSSTSPSSTPSSPTPSIQPVAVPSPDVYNPDNYTEADKSENDKNKKNEDERYKKEEDNQKQDENSNQEGKGKQEENSNQGGKGNQEENNNQKVDKKQ